MDWWTLVITTLQLYQQAAKETWKKIGQSWWIGLLPLLYGPLFFLTASFIAPLGIVGGFILGLVLAICTSSYLYFLAAVVNGIRVNIQDLGESWRPYLGSVISIMFFLYIVQYTLALLLPPSAETQTLAMLINWALLIVLNPIPEIIYLGRSEGFNMLQESVDFLRESGVEWFVPFLALALFSFILPLPVLLIPLYVGKLTFPTLSGGGMLLGSVAGLVWGVVSAFLLFVLMVFRGLLFRGLSGHTRRQRVFRSRFS